MKRIAPATGLILALCLALTGCAGMSRSAQSTDDALDAMGRAARDFSQ